MVWVLLAEQVLPEHVTIASRCTRVDFGPVPDDESRGGRWCPRTWPALIGPLWWRPRPRATFTVPGFWRPTSGWRPGNRHGGRPLRRLNGTGAAVAEVVAELRALIDDAGEALTARHRAEIVALDEREARFGTRGSGRRDIEAQHKREHRQFRTDEIRFGLATLTCPLPRADRIRAARSR